MVFTPPSARRHATVGAAVLVLALAGCASEPEEPDRTPATVGQVLAETAADGHRLRDVLAGDAPAVQLEVTEDSESGWNVEVRTERFTFTPERVGGDAQPGAGHAHLYLDGVKIARLYGPWYHLPASAVPVGEHTLTVQLNADDHTVWSADGDPVSAETQLTADGADAGHEHEDQPDASRSSPPATSEPAADVSVDVQVSGGEVAPAPGRTSVALGQTVRIEVVGDQPDVVHVHGYDVEAELTPSVPAVLEFTADQPGLFEVETHEAGLLLTQLVVE